MCFIINESFATLVLLEKHLNEYKEVNLKVSFNIILLFTKRILIHIYIYNVFIMETIMRENHYYGYH